MTVVSAVSEANYTPKKGMRMRKEKKNVCNSREKHLFRFPVDAFFPPIFSAQVEIEIL